jgi:ankyrin repeat protein
LFAWDGDERSAIAPSHQFDGWMLTGVTPALVSILTSKGELVELLLPKKLETVFRVERLESSDGSSVSIALDSIPGSKDKRPDSESPAGGYSQTYITACATVGDIVNAKTLIARGADPSTEHTPTPLMLASLHRNHRLVTLLLESGAAADTCSPSGYTALHYAASGDSHQAIILLCAADATVHARTTEGTTALHLAAKLRAKDRARTCCQDPWHPLQLLIGEGADPNARDDEGVTPILNTLGAADGDNTIVLEGLIRAGANTRLRAHDGTSVLRLCMAMENPMPTLMAIARALGKGEDTVFGLCCFLEAFRRNHWGLDKCEHALIEAAADFDPPLQFLASLGGNLDITNVHNLTVMHTATLKGNSSAIRRLLDAGASPRIYDLNGQTALDIALQRGDTQAVRVLRPIQDATLGTSAQGKDTKVSRRARRHRA